MKINQVGMYGGKFYPFHQGHLSMILRASTMVEQLYVVVSYSEVREKKLSADSNFPYMPFRLRMRWITESVRHLSNVTVIAVEDDAVDDLTYDWQSGADAIQSAIGLPIDLIFGSETSYEPIFKTLYPDSNYVLLDPERSQFPISATCIRKDGAFRHWHFIPAAVRPFFVKRIALVGTESCGKTTLSNKLAHYFDTCLVEEYGRTYTDEIGGSNGIMFNQDFQTIAYQHKVNEHHLLKSANKLLFIDSEAIVTQYYSHLYGEGKTHQLDSVIQYQNYDLILYLEPDVEWVQDGTRHHGTSLIRKQNNTLLKSLFAEYQTPYVSISGNWEERFNQAIAFVEHYCFK